MNKLPKLPFVTIILKYKVILFIFFRISERDYNMICGLSYVGRWEKGEMIL